MNKYSVKIIKFIDKIKDNDKILPSIDVNNKLIVQISNICDEVLKNIDEMRKLHFKTELLPKLHNKENQTLLYLFFREYNKSQNQISVNDFKDFINWYVNNQHTIDWDDINKKIRNNKQLQELYNLVFQKNLPREHLHNILYDNNFVGPDTQHYAEITDLKCIILELQQYKLTLRLYMEANRTDDTEMIVKVMSVVSIMYQINEQILKRKMSNLDLGIFLGKQRKYILNNDNLGPINVNSGSAIRRQSVNIWREEDLEKVLFHELQHYFQCDFYVLDDGYQIIENYIYSIFDIDGVDRINESFNETLAIILHSIYQSKQLNMDINAVFKYELFFNLLQCAKIIDYYGGLNYNQLFKNTHMHIVFKQTTSVLSYYIIKTFLLYNIDKTLTQIEAFNMKCNDKDSILKFKILLVEVLKNKEMEDIINKLINIVKQMNKNKYIYKTLRMSTIS